MNATELQKENERLKKLLSRQAAELSGQVIELEQAREHHTAVVTQFSQALEAKQRSIAQLEHQIKLLLQKIKGSRQERIDPDQLTLFSLEELEQIVKKLESEGLSLEDSLEMFEKGIKLSRQCAKKLSEAEKKVATLLKELEKERQEDVSPQDHQQSA